MLSKYDSIKERVPKIHRNMHTDNKETKSYQNISYFREIQINTVVSYHCASLEKMYINYNLHITHDNSK